MKRLTIAMVAEGTSDFALRWPIQDLFIRAGADEVRVVPLNPREVPRLGSTLEARLKQVAELVPDVDAVLVHRDSDSRDPSGRYAEIEAKWDLASPPGQLVAVVPVRETETWALVDITRIKQVAGQPDAPGRLNIPRPRKLEDLARPKEALQSALASASGLTGRRLASFRRRFGYMRRILLEQLDINGEIDQLSAWRRLDGRIRETVSNVSNRKPTH